MIKADDVQMLFARVFLAAHQLFGPNQKPIALRFLFTSIRDRISLNNLLAALCKTPQHQSAAFERIISLAVRAHLHELFVIYSDHLDPVATAPGSDTASA